MEMYQMSLKRCLPILILCSMISPNYTEPDMRIIGGELCEPETSTFAVSLQKSKFHFCGGSLIKLDTVMTAAHCMVNVEGAHIEVVVGITNTMLKGTQRRKAKHVFIHEESKKLKDIAIIKLHRAFRESPNVGIVSLPTERIEQLETKCPMGLVMGWGHKEVYNPKEDPNFNYVWDGNLLCVSLSLLANQKCQTYVPDFVPNWIFCAWHEPGGKDACVGDSGGPIICDGMQIGIVSSGYGCGLPEKPAFYVRVDRMLDFIASKMDNLLERSNIGSSTGSSFNLLILTIPVFILCISNNF